MRTGGGSGGGRAKKREAEADQDEDQPLSAWNCALERLASEKKQITGAPACGEELQRAKIRRHEGSLDGDQSRSGKAGLD